jgi:hypothetical protein
MTGLKISDFFQQNSPDRRIFVDRIKPWFQVPPKVSVTARGVVLLEMASLIAFS